ncbi:MAG: CpaF family protein [Oligoflexales bacterium]|nr:CpaF family protein [Oligoflexales bacterium]
MKELDFINSNLLCHFSNPDISEVFVNGIKSKVLLKSDQKVEVYSSPFSNEEEMNRTFQIFASKNRVRLDPLSPSAGGAYDYFFPGGKILIRWHVVLAPLSRGGAVLSLRRHRFDEINIDRFGCSHELRSHLFRLIHEREPIFICGPTGSGKTSLLVSMLSLLGETERVVIIEDVPEISLECKTWIHLVSSRPNIEGAGEFTLSRIFDDALRLRPDRIVVGEVRGSEVETLFKAVVSGHKGIMTTLHIDTPMAVFPRLTQLSCGALNWRQVFDICSPYLVFLERGSPNRISNIFSYHKRSFQSLT